MPEMDTRAWKLREFAAHSDNVNSVCLGPATGQYIVTGGADKTVHLWTLEKPNCLASYTGHTTQVVCVNLSLTEDQICAGALGGAIKIYDIGSAKVSRTLMGHRAAIRSIESHPEGTMIMSCSADSIIKLWDVRKRGSILSCKGHSSAINSVKFSCNGSWFASASDDQKIKIWELRKGQILHEFTDHSAPVTSLVFHPHVMKLSSCSSDGALKCFDLNKLVVSSSMTLKRKPFLSRLYSYRRGASVLGASEEQLLVYGWGATEFSDSVNVCWGKIHDMQESNGRLIAVSSKRSYVSLYSVNLDRLKSQFTCLNDPLSCGDGSAIGRIESETLRSEVKLNLDDDEAGDVSKSNAFQPTKILPRTPPVSARHLLRSEDASMAKNELSRGGNCGSVMALPKQTTESEELSESKQTEKSEQSWNFSDGKKVEPHAGVCLEEVTTSETLPAIAEVEEVPDELETSSTASDKTTEHKEGETAPEASPIDLSKKSEMLPQSTKPPVVPRKPEKLQNSTNKSLKKDFEVKIFEPEKPIEAFKKFEGPEKPDELNSIDSIVKLTPISYVASESEIIGTISREHSLILTALKNRQKSLRELLQVWKTKNVKATSEMAIKSNDLTTATDFISVLILHPSRWTLDLCVILLPTIVKLIHSRHEYHVTTGCDSVRRIVRNFGSVIRSNTNSPVETLGVDLCQEERYQKCLICHNHLSVIREFIRSKEGSRGKINLLLQELMEPLASALT